VEIATCLRCSLTAAPNLVDERASFLVAIEKDLREGVDVDPLRFCRNQRSASRTLCGMETVKQAPTTLEPLLTIGDVSQALNVSRATVYRLMESGELEPVRILSRTRFEPTEVRGYIERHREQSTAETREPGSAGPLGSRDDDDAESSAPPQRA
jgi:excisionase family DNA binding protein